MGRNMKKAAALLLVALMVITMAPSSVFASARKPKEAFKTSQTVYMQPNSYGGDTSISIQLGDLAKSKTISNVKSSNTAVLQPYRLYRRISTSTETDLTTNKVTNTYSDNSGSISMYAKKTGTATISFKADKKNYSCKVTVLAYTNPVKTLKFAGIGTTNFKSLFKKYADNNNGSALKANAKAGFIQLTAASGWKIKSAQFSKYNSDHTYFFDCWSEESCPSSIKMWFPSVKKGVGFYFYLTFVNTKTGGELQVNSNIK